MTALVPDRSEKRPASTLVTGGARSGKSRWAVSLAQGAAKKAFLATAEPFDEGMRRRIAAHRAERDASFVTLEEPVALAPALGRLPPGTEVAVVDCLTVWLGNLVHRRSGNSPECLETATLESFPEITSFLELLEAPPCDLILVSNEVGMGIVPEEPLARAFRDLAGWLNQRVAAVSQRVILMVSGVPLEVKG